MALPKGVITSRELATLFDRHFAEEAVPSDIFMSSAGTLTLLGLLPAVRHRPTLLAMALAATLLAATQLLLAQHARKFYTRHRPALLLLHFASFAFVGSALQQPTNVARQLAPAPPIYFLLASVVSSSLPWHSLNALLYRLRLRQFLWLRPLVALATLPNEWRLCKATCARLPASARAFDLAADALRRGASFFLPMPQLVAASTAADTTSTSCLKLRVFVLLVFGLIVPALLRQHAEKKLLARFIAQHGLVVVPNKEAAEFAALEVEAAAAAAAAAEAELGGAGKPAKRAAGSTFEGCCPASCPGTPDGGDSPRRLGLLEQRRQTAARLAERRAALDDRWGGLWEVASEEQVPCWPRGVRLPLMAVACWHAVDALL